MTNNPKCQTPKITNTFSRRSNRARGPSTRSPHTRARAALSRRSPVMDARQLVARSNDALRHKDFEGAAIMIDADITFVQIATGENVQSVDLDTYSLSLNESWPLLMDESDASVGKSFPSGATDAVIVIDSAGFITSWQPGTMSALEIEEAASSASKGSGNNPLSLFSMIISTAAVSYTHLTLPTKRIV